MLGAGQRLEELDAQQRGHRVGQHALDGAGRRGNSKYEGQGKALNVSAVQNPKHCFICLLSLEEPGAKYQQNQRTRFTETFKTPSLDEHQQLVQQSKF